jgi:hypothetical protein
MTRPDQPARDCPRCWHTYKDHPALSRRDNETLICPRCGTAEALEDFVKTLAYTPKRETPAPATERPMPKPTDEMIELEEQYQPFVVVDETGQFGGGELLISVFVTAEGLVVDLARRDDTYDRWSPPVRAVRR